jgi:exodeoxyribonuclease VII large subunit
VHTIEARPAFAGFAGRLALRGRHVAELAGELRHTLSSALGRRIRRHDALRRALDQFDPRHRLAAVATRLIAQDARLAAAIARRRHAAESRFRASAGRLEGLSPLGVLARGYAVCWADDRTRIVRDASAVAPGDRVLITLERGELGCTVTETQMAAESANGGKPAGA